MTVFVFHCHYTPLIPLWELKNEVPYIQVMGCMFSRSPPHPSLPNSWRTITKVLEFFLISHSVIKHFIPQWIPNKGHSPPSMYQPWGLLSNRIQSQLSLHLQALSGKNTCTLDLILVGVQSRIYSAEVIVDKHVSSQKEAIPFSPHSSGPVFCLTAHPAQDWAQTSTQCWPGWMTWISCSAQTHL